MSVSMRSTEWWITVNAWYESASDAERAEADRLFAKLMSDRVQAMNDVMAAWDAYIAEVERRTPALPESS